MLNLARSAISKALVDRYLDLDECIENHRTALIQIDLVFLHGRFLGWRIRILNMSVELSKATDYTHR